MEKIFRVPLKFGGYKYFYGENAETEANAYEVEMKQKEIEEKERQKREQEERVKALEKARAERKKKEEIIKTLKEKIEYHIAELNAMVEAYENETGEKQEYTIFEGKLTIHKANPYYGTPYINFNETNSHDDWWNRLYKAIREVK